MCKGQSVLSLYHVSLADRTQAVRLGGERLCLLSRLSDLQVCEMKYNTKDSPRVCTTLRRARPQLPHKGSHGDVTSFGS